MRWWGVLLLAAACRHPAAAPEPPPATTGTTITVTLEGDGDPPMLAYRDGDGPWRALSAQDGAYRFEAAGRFQVARGCPRDMAPMLLVYALTVHDATTFAIDRCWEGGPTTEIDGEIVGVEPDPVAVVYTGYFPTKLTAKGRFHATVGAAGVDVVVLAGRGELRKGDWLTRRVAVSRLSDATDSEVVIDMDAQGVALDQREVSVIGASPGEEVEVWSRYVTEHGAHAVLSIDHAEPYVAAVLPGAKAALSVVATSEHARRTVSGDAGAKLELMAPLGAVAIEPLGNALRASWPRHADAESYSVIALDGTKTQWCVVAADWTATDTLIFETPAIDLPGWNEFAVRSRYAADWTVSANDFAIFSESRQRTRTAERWGRASTKIGVMSSQ